MNPLQRSPSPAPPATTIHLPESLTGRCTSILAPFPDPKGSPGKEHRQGVGHDSSTYESDVRQIEPAGVGEQADGTFDVGAMV